MPENSIVAAGLPATGVMMGFPSETKQLYFVYLGETLVGPALAGSEKEAIEKIIRSTPWVRPHRSSLMARFDAAADAQKDDHNHDQQSAVQLLSFPGRNVDTFKTAAPASPLPSQLEKECFCYEITNSYHIHVSDCPNNPGREG